MQILLDRLLTGTMEPLYLFQLLAMVVGSIALQVIVVGFLISTKKLYCEFLMHNVILMIN
jgi:hypothetical protein